MPQYEWLIAKAQMIVDRAKSEQPMNDRDSIQELATLVCHALRALLEHHQSVRELNRRLHELEKGG